MKVCYKNSGSYAKYALEGSVLSFGDGELRLDLALLQRPYPQRLIVSADENGRPVLGAAWRYVAEVELPAAEFSVEETGVADDVGFPVLRKVRAEFSAENVVLTLWALKEA